MDTKLGRDSILGAKDLASEVVKVPEWGGEVRVKALSANERDLFEMSLLEKAADGEESTNLANIRAKLAVLCVVDDEGNRLFKDEDAEALGKKSAAALGRIFNVAQRLAGLSKEDVAELEAGLGGARPDASHSA